MSKTLLALIRECMDENDCLIAIFDKESILPDDVMQKLNDNNEDYSYYFKEFILNELDLESEFDN